ncbi:LOW QUALITY PROTEIN: Ig heavy chain Mem5-like [Calypte anna]|uniref:LOW QUALITY PROTEIN: Ig heavy chain Mem5-like n=1 Tax=Calypte anna TaxID=9244 RepID=UPI0011C3B3EA|nr:LOW QUALITY PROTEIN: Ig heavy chain Mem5-like [Calypte anna]
MVAVGLGLWLLALLVALGPAGVWAQLRLVETGRGLRVAGDSVNLSCHGSVFNSFERYAVWWYRQTPNGIRELVSICWALRKAFYGAVMEGRVTVSWDNSQSKSYLSLRDLHLQDSARYYCAILYHLQSDRTARLVFGTGTQLTVEPKIQKSSDPEVIMIKSKKLKEDGSTGKAACLARNIYTKNIVLEMSSDEVLYEQNRSILTSESLYNTIKVVSVKNNMDVTCVAKFDGSTLTANTTLPEQKAEGPVSGKVCSTTGNSAEADPKVEKTNMLAMAVLGLRILMAKSIAFNTVMSVKLFLF